MLWSPLFMVEESKVQDLKEFAQGPLQQSDGTFQSSLPPIPPNFVIFCFLQSPPEKAWCMKKEAALERIPTYRFLFKRFVIFMCNRVYV